MSEKNTTMSLSEDTITVLHKNTIQYLHNIAENVPSTSSLLKSYYSSKFKIAELHTKICLEKSKNKLDSRCSQCCLKLQDTFPSYVVKPEAKRSKFARKMLKKVESKQLLTKYQETYLKKTILKQGTKLVATCSFCKNPVTRYCRKPVKVREDVSANKVIDQPKRKRPRKRKDKFCGLQQEAVTAVQVENTNYHLSKKAPQISIPSNVVQNNIITKNKPMNQHQTKKNKQFKSKLKSLFKDNNVAPKNNLTQFLQSLN